MSATPWYPDDSGEWIEVVDGQRPANLADGDEIGVLFGFERDAKRKSTILPEWDFARRFKFVWGASKRRADEPPRVVAYRVYATAAEVEAAKSAPKWYPDKSGEWVDVEDGRRPATLDRDAPIVFMHGHERRGKYFNKKSPQAAWTCDWRKIVAYKCAAKGGAA